MATLGKLLIASVMIEVVGYIAYASVAILAVYYLNQSEFWLPS